MVAAERAGRKSQTRRVVKGKALDWLQPGMFTPEYVADPANSLCPYGAPGDQLWVRETYYQLGHWEPIAGEVTRKGSRQKWRFVPDSEDVLFEAPAEFRKGRHHADPQTSAWHKRLGRFMPRKYSRRTLEVTEVRVERVQDISDTDAIAEGLIPVGGPHGQQMWAYSETTGGYFADPCVAFQMLWHSINGAESWSANPWVWVVSFKRVDG